MSASTNSKTYKIKIVQLHAYSDYYHDCCYSDPSFSDSTGWEEVDYETYRKLKNWGYQKNRETRKNSAENKSYILILEDVGLSVTRCLADYQRMRDEAAKKQEEKARLKQLAAAAKRARAEAEARDREAAERKRLKELLEIYGVPS